MGVPIAIGRSRLHIGRSRLLLGVLGDGLGVPDCYWAFSAMDWATIGRRLSEETIRGDYPKETIRRRLSEGDYPRRLFEGDYSKEWRTRYFLKKVLSNTSCHS